MSPVPSVERCACTLPLTVVVAGAGSVLSLALRSGQATPRSGSGSSGALGSSSAGFGATGAICASNGAGSNAEAAAAHSSRAPLTLKPRPIIQIEALTSAPEPRQYVPRAIGTAY